MKASTTSCCDLRGETGAFVAGALAVADVAEAACFPVDPSSDDVGLDGTQAVAKRNERERSVYVFMSCGCASDRARGRCSWYLFRVEMAKPVHLQLASDAALSDSHIVPEPALPAHVLAVAGERASRGIGGAMATILERQGSTPSTPGQKLWVGADGSCVGNVGGGAVEREILAALSELARATGDRVHEVRAFKLGQELGMCCGGRVVALLEPIAGLVPCLIVGGGHVATALAPLLARIGFAVTIVDAREAWGREGRIDGVVSIVGDYDDVGKEMPRSGAFLVMTHDHALDQQAIEWGVRQGFAFVGGVGSRAKAQRTRDRLVAKGFAEGDVTRVRMPLGISIGARLPDEIAMSIASELIAWRHAKARDVAAHVHTHGDETKE
jgi:xanthine dehydrogenase accessory factor